jgi:hypothetical protein
MMRVEARGPVHSFCGHNVKGLRGLPLSQDVSGRVMTSRNFPYRGAAPVLQDVITGRVDSFFNNIAPVMPLISDGKVRALG